MHSLPSYTYVPGTTPHPHSVRRGTPSTDAGTAAPEESFQWGLTLFHHGYYWEAHEVWEELWIKAGRRGPQADLLKGLILNQANPDWRF